MDAHLDPFAPIEAAETVQASERSHPASTEPVVVTPVPDNAEKPHLAAERLMGIKCDDHWRYHDANRRLLFVVLRWDTPNLNEKKEIHTLSWVRYPDGREDWAVKDPPAPRPLFQLNELKNLGDRLVVIVEGEKCARWAKPAFRDAIVTTSPGGPEAACEADWTPLAQAKEVLIWPDADKPGNDYANDVALILHRLGVRNIRIIDADALVARRPAPGVFESAGWDVADGIEEGWDALELRKAAEACARFWVPPAPETKWPASFKMTARGLVRIIDDQDDECEPELIAEPFEVVGEGRDRRGAGRGVFLAWRDADGRDQRGFVRHAHLIGAGVEWLKNLTDRGFPGPIENKKIRWLKQALYGVRPIHRITMVTRTGWVGPAFVMPHKTIGESGGESLIFDGRTDLARYGEHGTIDDWREKVARPTAGNSRLVFCLSLSLAGPIVDLLEEASFGFNLTGPSSVGKTTAVIVAGSSWGGGGPLGFAHSCRVTDNGAEDIAAAHSGTLLPLDDLAQLSPNVALSLSYMLGNGIGKVRAARKGGAKLSAEWRIVFLTTGEIGIAGKIEEAGRGRKVKAGSLVRLLDLPADAQKGYGLFDDCHGEQASEFAQHLKSNALAHYGCAGPEFVAQLAQLLRTEPDFKRVLRDRIDSVQQQLLPEVGTVDGQVQRAARHFAIVAVTGEYARKLLGLTWAEDEPISAVRACFAAWMSQRGGAVSHELIMAKTALRDAIEMHGESRFVRLHGLSDDALEDTQSQLIRDRLGFRYDLKGEPVWGFLPSGLREVLGGLGGFHTLVAKLVEQGVILRRPPPHRITFDKKINGEKLRLYVVPHSALLEDE